MADLRYGGPLPLLLNAAELLVYYVRFADHITDVLISLH